MFPPCWRFNWRDFTQNVFKASPKSAHLSPALEKQIWPDFYAQSLFERKTYSLFSIPDCGFPSPDPSNARVWLCCVQLCHLTPVAHTVPLRQKDLSRYSSCQSRKQNDNIAAWWPRRCWEKAQCILTWWCSSGYLSKLLVVVCKQ